MAENEEAWISGKTIPFKMSYECLYMVELVTDRISSAFNTLAEWVFIQFPSLDTFGSSDHKTQKFFPTAFKLTAALIQIWPW